MIIQVPSTQSECVVLCVKAHTKIVISVVREKIYEF